MALESNQLIDRVEIEIPNDCHLIRHDLFKYDPTTDFSVSANLKYLNEDLFQCTFPKDHLIIDLGWYGDLVTNRGEFKIQVIRNENWEIPESTIHEKSTREVELLLGRILLFYTNTNQDEHDV